jgi:hypothetical protein
MKPILEILKPDYVFVHTLLQLQQHYLRYAGLKCAMLEAGFTLLIINHLHFRRDEPSVDR